MTGPLLVGGYVPAEGIGWLTPGPGGWRYSLAVAAPSPSWLTAHPRLPVVYACLEASGAIQAFRLGEGRLEAWSEPVPVGDGPCHASVIDDQLWVSCWGDGQVGLVPLDGEGRPQRPTLLPLPAARAGGRPPRAHQALALPDGTVLTIDMGVDLLRWWRDGSLTAELQLPEGSGPRHAVAGDGLVHVVTEGSCEVLTLEPSGGWRVVDAVRLPAARPGAGDFASGIVRHGRRLVTAVRGGDVVVVLEPRGRGLKVVASLPAGVAWPRSLTIVDDTLIVTGERSGQVALLPLDPQTSAIGAPGLVPAPAPTAVIRAPAPPGTEPGVR